MKKIRFYYTIVFILYLCFTSFINPLFVTNYNFNIVEDELPKLIFVESGFYKSSNIEDSIFIDNYYIGKYEVTTQEFVKFLNDISNDIYIDQYEVFYEQKLILALKCFYERGGIECPGIDFIEYSKKEISEDKFRVKEGFENHPVNLVTWDGASMYCEWLSKKTGDNYKLPSIIEWEYAALGGHLYDKRRPPTKNDIHEASWCGDSTFISTARKVGTKSPNELGIFDMYGNLWEWCQEPQREGNLIPVKGGSFFQSCDYSKLKSVWYCSRFSYARVFGFRVVMKPKFI